jgi:hypothetical protein
VCHPGQASLLFSSGTHFGAEDALFASQIPPFRSKRVNARDRSHLSNRSFQKQALLQRKQTLRCSHSSGNEVAFRVVLLETVGSKSDPDTRCPA